MAGNKVRCSACGAEFDSQMQLQDHNAKAHEFGKMGGEQAGKEKELPRE